MYFTRDCHSTGQAVLHPRSLALEVSGKYWRHLQGDLEGGTHLSEFDQQLPLFRMHVWFLLGIPILIHFWSPVHRMHCDW
eukprot:2820486-Pyramimonas_sp.AAC.1